MSATQRIDQLRTEIADYRAKELLKSLDLPENRGFAFLNTALGNRSADHLETMLKDPFTLMAAIIAYLEEKGI